MKKLISNDYIYEDIVKWNYRTEYSCQKSGCDDEGICRCGTIVDAGVEGVNVSKFTDSIYLAYYGNDKSTKRDAKINTILFGTGKELDIYTIDRILRINRIWDPINWELEIVGGYYGQEINSVKLKEGLSKKIEHELNKALEINNINDRIEYLLNLEYGYILDELKGCEYSIGEVFINNIKIGSKKHLEKVKSEKLDHYKGYNGIMGIVLFDGVNYRLIDGYHRMTSNNKSYVKVIVAKK